MKKARQIAFQVIWNTWKVGWEDLKEQCFPLFRMDQQSAEGIVKGTSNRITIIALGVLMFLVYWAAHTTRSSWSTLRFLWSVVTNKFPRDVINLFDEDFPAQIYDTYGSQIFMSNIQFDCYYFPHAHLICHWECGKTKIFTNFKEFEAFLNQEWKRNG